MVHSFVFFMLVCCFLRTSEAEDVRSYFTAAVYEHRPRLTSDISANDVVELNLEAYEIAARTAKLKGADVILFPETGIFQANSRDQAKQFMEIIPDPRVEIINPCTDGLTFSDRPILLTLSCIASNNAMVVVANTGDIQDCSRDDSCPPDGVFLYNTNVVFDRDGTLILKYHENAPSIFKAEYGILYSAYSEIDFPKIKQSNIFLTDFGTFATGFTSDLFYTKTEEVDAIFLPTRWVDRFPESVSVSWFQSWALANNMTLFAANVHLPGTYAVGSGIFHSTYGALAYTFDPDGVSKIIVSNVNKRGFQLIPSNPSIIAINGDISNDGYSVPSQCSERLLGASKSIFNDYRCQESTLKNHTLVKLVEPSGQLEVCDNGTCCSLSYTTSGGFGNETFYLSASNGNFSDQLSLENGPGCLLVRCDALGDEACATFPLRSQTRFLDVYLRANFSSDILLYTQVVESGVRLVPLTDWHTHSSEVTHHPHHHHPHFENLHHHVGYEMDERSLHFENKLGRRLISLGMRGYFSM